MRRRAAEGSNGRAAPRTALLVAAFLLVGCAAGESGGPPAEPTPATPSPTEHERVNLPHPDDPAGGGTPAPDVPTDVEVSEEEITDQEGNVLLTVASLPDSVQPAPDTEFGGPTHFTGVELSDDGAWLAIGSAGAVHSYGWLYDLVAEQHHLVAFQYGGSLDAHSWSPDDRFALFTIGTPAATELLKVVDRDDIRSHSRDTGFVVEVDQEGDPPFAYEFTEWRNPHTLCFAFDGAPYCVDAGTPEPEPVE